MLPELTDRLRKLVFTRLSMTQAYIVALCLIACAMIVSYVLMTNKVTTEIDRAHVINIAGMQRMLSQRIALMAREVSASDSAEANSKLTDKFSVALDRFDENHTRLTSLLDSDTAPEILSLYAGPDGVDLRSQRYISLAREFEQLNKIGNDPEQKNQAMRELLAIATNGFITELDAVVQQYEIEATAAVSNFLKLELAVLCIGLLLLVGEALFIFRPIIKAARLRSEQLEKSNRELMEFSFRISHDLRSPVSSCKGMIEIGQEAIEDEDTEMVVHVMSRMDNALTRLETLIEDIITVTRNSVSATTVEHVNLHEMVNDTLASLSSMEGFEKFKFDIDIQGEQELFTKKLYLQQILQNLISNAVKYTRPIDDVSSDKHEAVVTIASKQDGKKFDVTVTDGGPGIPENCRDKLFGMFNRFHPEKAQGSGLGLYLTKQNAIALGGNLEYQPLPNGSAFHLRFTAAKAPSA